MIWEFHEYFYKIFKKFVFSRKIPHIVAYYFNSDTNLGRSVYLATCSTIRRPIDFYLGITILYSQSVLVPYRPVSDQKFSVVSCFSPLFYMERWQLLIATVKIFYKMKPLEYIHEFQTPKFLNFIILLNLKIRNFR